MKKRIGCTLLSGLLLATLVTSASAIAETTQEFLISSYDSNSLVKADGTYWIWGGDGLPTVPTQIHGLTDVKTGLGNHYVSKTDGTLWHWKKRVDSATDYELREIEGIREPIATLAGFDSEDQTLILDQEGNVYRLEDMDSGSAVGTVSRLKEIYGVQEMSSYYDEHYKRGFFVYLKKDGTVWRSDDDLATFAQATEIQGAAHVRANGVLLKDGYVREWPNGGESAAKTKSANWKEIPTKQVQGVAKLRQYDSNGSSSVGIDEQNILWFWGAAINGYDSANSSIAWSYRSPIKLKLMGDVKQAALVGDSVVALTYGGGFYQSSVQSNRLYANTQFKQWDSDIVSLGPGKNHVIMRRADGSLWGWGGDPQAEQGYGGWPGLVSVPVHPPLEIILNGESIALANGAMTKNGQTYVPMRSLFEKLGAKVSWDEQNKVAMLEKEASGAKTIVMRFNFRMQAGTLNGERITLQNGLFSSNGSTYLPLRFISEQFGAKVEWAKQEGRVYIEMN